MKHVVDGQHPFFVRRTAVQYSPCGWRTTSNGFALVGCEPCPPERYGAYELDWLETHTDTEASRLWRGSMFDIIKLLDQSRRYQFVAGSDLQGETPVAHYEFIAGPFEVDFRTFDVKNAPARYKLRCAGCGESSKWYLPASRRYLLSFQSQHRCPR